MFILKRGGLRPAVTLKVVQKNTKSLVEKYLFINK